MDEFEVGSEYSILVGIRFVGRFQRFIKEENKTYAIFEQTGRTDRGQIPIRKVLVENILNSDKRD